MSCKYRKKELSELQSDLLDRLRQKVQNTSSNFLPTSEKMGQEFNVSTPTMLKVLAILKEEGLLAFGRGQRIRIAGRKSSDSKQKRINATKKVSDEILATIFNGSLKQGDIVPKNRYYVSQKRVSPATVSRAMQSLASEGFIYKSGKNWIVGQPSKTNLTSILSRPDLILVLISKPGLWRALCSETYLAQFYQSFLREAETRHIKVETVLTDDRSYRGIMPAGRLRIQNYVRENRERIRGLLVPRYDRDIGSKLDLVQFFCKKNIPVVYFNDDNQNHTEFDAVRNSSSFWECIYDFSVSCDFIAEIIRDTNHIETGFINSKDQSNPQNFKALLQERMHRICPQNQLIDINPTNVFWEKLFSGSIEKNIQRIHKQGLAHMKSFIGPYCEMTGPEVERQLRFLQSKTRGSILGYSAVLAPVLLKNRGIRLLICANHLQARLCYYWLRASRLLHPEGVSLLSIGDSVSSIGIPVSIIDTGLSYLGRCALHALLGYTMRSIYPSRRIIPKAQFVNRGSFGYPGTRDFSDRLKGEIM